MNTILFDLDGTLLPMEQEAFLQGYFGALCTRFAPQGYAPKQLVSTLWQGTKAMVMNDGSVCNRDRFWNEFAAVYGQERLADEAQFDDFYGNEFNSAAVHTQPTPLAKQCVELLKAKGYTLILATNPLFPRVGTLTRMRWAGLDADDFAHITTYENASYCKPNPAYYQEICDKMGIDPADCMMIGNDAKEDLAAAQIGMDTYLVTDCYIPNEKVGISGVKQGRLPDLLAYLEKLPEIG